MSDRFGLALPGFAAREPIWRDVVCPFDREPFAQVEFAGEAALAHALDTAVTAHAEWSATPAWRRAEILRAAATAVRASRDDLAMRIATEGGKPLADAEVEATRAAVTLDACADTALHLDGERVGMERAPGTEHHVAFTTREPIGVVLAISAFNHPLNLACHQAGAALAAGNACVLKPASTTPTSAIALARILADAGLPDGVLQVVPAAGAAVTPLVESPAVRFISFIGSADVGWGLRRRAADGTRLALEHGGNAATIVLADADLDRAVPAITRGAFYHAGQVCVSTQRVYVERAVEAAFTERLVAAARDLVCGDARDRATDIGPLIEPDEVTRVDAWVGQATSAGAERLLGGEPLGPTVYGTTVLRGAPEEADVIAKEVFGPVVAIQPVADLDEAVAKVNASVSPFQSSIFTQDVDRAFDAARHVEAAAFMVNDLTAFRVDWMPFGGWREAGLGVGGTEHGVREMTREKLVVIRPR